MFTYIYANCSNSGKNMFDYISDVFSLYNIYCIYSKNYQYILRPSLNSDKIVNDDVKRKDKEGPNV